MIGSVVEHVNSGIPDPWNPQETGGFDFSLVHIWLKNYELVYQLKIDYRQKTFAKSSMVATSN